jgi:hypothetical protein
MLVSNSGDSNVDTTAKQNLLSDLKEVHLDLAYWAEDRMREGASVQEIIEQLRRAADLVGRP